MGINVVTPVKLPVENPQKYEDTNFVVYPFIEGQKYGGKKQEIYEAGKMLGKIHSVSPESNTYDLSEYDVYDFNEQEVEESMSSQRQLHHSHGSTIWEIQTFSH